MQRLKNLVRGKIRFDGAIISVIAAFAFTNFVISFAFAGGGASYKLTALNDMDMGTVQKSAGATGFLSMDTNGTMTCDAGFTCPATSAASISSGANWNCCRHWSLTWIPIAVRLARHG